VTSFNAKGTSPDPGAEPRESIFKTGQVWPNPDGPKEQSAEAGRK
jgi:hypothetical protein